MNERLKDILGDLRHITIFPARYKTGLGHGSEYWRGVLRKYCNAEKMMDSSCFRWYIIEYQGGHKELAYLRVLKDGMFSGKLPAIYRGVFIPRRMDFVTFSHVAKIRLAF